MAPPAGIEPATIRLTAGRSTAELQGIIGVLYPLFGGCVKWIYVNFLFASPLSLPNL